MKDSDWLKDFFLTSGLLTSLGVWLKNLIQKKNVQQAEKAVLHSAEIYDHLNDLGSRLNADRVLLLYTSNGGGVPSAGTPLFVTVLYEIVAGDGLESLRSHFQHVPVDHGYLKVLKTLVSDGVWEGGAEDLEKGFLKDVYINENVKQGRMVPLLATKTKYYYLSIRWMEGSDIPTDEQIRVQTLLAQTNITKLLSK